MSAEQPLQPRRIGHLGPPGTHGEEALRAALGEHVSDVELIALDSNGDVVRAVEAGAVDAGFVPIENSIEGAVTETLDALVHEAPGVQIIGEFVWAAHHCLIAGGEVPFDEITTVASHPQALAQCAHFLAERLPGAERLAQVSTAGAVRLAIKNGTGFAAIGSSLAAEIHGGVVLAERIEDVSSNKTRFVWLGKPPVAVPPAGRAEAAAEKTSLVFAGFNDTSPGGLVGILNEFARREVNMSKIESRPERTSLGHYLFFVDLDGAVQDPAIAEAVEGVRAKVRSLRILGSFTAFEA